MQIKGVQGGNHVLMRLERQYLQALSQQGLDSPAALSTVVLLSNKFIEEGNSLQNIGNLQQAEVFFQKAKDVTAPIQSSQNNCLQPEFILTRGLSILKLSQLLEKQQNYHKAFLLLKEIIPLFERFEDEMRKKQERDVFELYVKILFHVTENCYMMKKKSECVEYGQKCIEIMRMLGINGENILELTQSGEHQNELRDLLELKKKDYLMLSRVNFIVGKQQFKFELDRAASTHLMHATILSHLILGSENPVTMKYQNKFQAISQKLEFQKALHGDIQNFKKFEQGAADEQIQKVDTKQKKVFQQVQQQNFKIRKNQTKDVEIQNESNYLKLFKVENTVEGPPIKQLIKPFIPKFISPPKQTYHSLMNQINSKMSKYHMPEYISKVRQDYEEKLNSKSDNQHLIKILERERDSLPQTQVNGLFVIQSPRNLSYHRKLSIQNSARSNYVGRDFMQHDCTTDYVSGDLLFSYRSSKVMKSQRESLHRPQTAKPVINDIILNEIKFQIICNHSDQFDHYEIKKEINIKSMMIQRPQFYSQHQREKAKKSKDASSVEQKKKKQETSLEKSSKKEKEKEKDKRRNVVPKKNKPPTLSTVQSNESEKISRLQTARQPQRLASSQLLKISSDIHLAEINEENSGIFNNIVGIQSRVENQTQERLNTSLKLDNDINPYLRPNTEQSYIINSQPSFKENVIVDPVNWIDQYLEYFTLDELDDAAYKITIFFQTLKKKNEKLGGKARRSNKRASNLNQSKRVKSGHSQLSKSSKSSQIDELIPRIPSTQTARHSHIVRTSAQRTVTNPMQNPMLESLTIKSSTKAKPSQVGFGQLLKDIKSTENVESTNRSKKVLQFVNDIFYLQTCQITFYEKFFYDTEQTLWKVEDHQFHMYCPLQVQNIITQHTNQDLITSYNFENQSDYDRYLNRILQNNLATKALSLISSIQISNNYFKGRIRIVILNIVNYLEEIQEQVYSDRNHLFECLLTIYMKQKNTYHKWLSYQNEKKPQTIIFLVNSVKGDTNSMYSKICHTFIDKILYLIRTYIKYVKKVSGDCLVNTLEETEQKKQQFYYTNDEMYYNLENFQFNFKIQLDQVKNICQLKRSLLKKEMIQLEDIKQPQFQDESHFILDESPVLPIKKRMLYPQLSINIGQQLSIQEENYDNNQSDIMESNNEQKNSFLINNTMTENNYDVSFNDEEQNVINVNSEDKSSLLKSQVIPSDQIPPNPKQAQIEKIGKKISLRYSMIKNAKTANLQSETLINQNSPQIPRAQLNQSVQQNYDFTSIAHSAQSSLLKVDVTGGTNSPKKGATTIELRKIYSISEDNPIQSHPMSKVNIIRKSQFINPVTVLDNQYYFNLSEQDFLRDNFSQFNLATKSQVDSYQINQIFDLQRQKLRIYKGNYFHPMANNIPLDVPDFQYALPNKFLFHNQIIKHQHEFYLLSVQIYRQDALQDYESSEVTLHLQQMSVKNMWSDQCQITFEQLIQWVCENNLQNNPTKFLANTKHSLLFQGRIPVKVQQNLVLKLPKLIDIQDCHLLIDTVEHIEQNTLKFNEQVNQLGNIVNDKSLFLQIDMERNQFQDALFILWNNSLSNITQQKVYILEQLSFTTETSLPILKLIKDQCQIKIGIKGGEIFSSLKNRNPIQVTVQRIPQTLTIIHEDINKHLELLHDRYLIVGKDIQTFQNYNSLFILNNNKYYLKLQETKNGHKMVHNIKVEFISKNKKPSDHAALDSLNDQIYKLDLITLRTSLYPLMKAGQIYARLTLFDSNQKTYYYRDIHKFDSLEKVSHLLQVSSQMFQDEVICSKLFKYSSQFKKKFIGTVLDFDTSSQRDPKRQLRRIKEKQNELDMFLLMYIQDADSLTANLATQARVLQQTVLFHFHKQQFKLTIISSNMLEDVREQKFLMRTYFLSKRFYQYSKVKNMGKVLVQTQVFRFNKLYLRKAGSDAGQVFFYLLISPQDSKTKLFKLVLDLSDVQNLIWNKVTADNCFDDIILYDTIKKIISSIVCYGSNTYKGLKLPLSTISQNKEKHKYDLINSFGETTSGGDIFKNLKNKQKQQAQYSKSLDIISPRYTMLLPLINGEPRDDLNSSENDVENNQKDLNLNQNQNQLIDKMVLELNAFPREVINILSNHTMLTPVYRGLKTIYKQVRKLNNKYLIITVSHYPQLQFYQLRFYIPQTCRSFVCFMYPSDFWVMEPEFFEDIFPSQLVQQNELIDQLFETQWKFGEIAKVYDIIKQDPQALIQIQQQAFATQHQQSSKVITPFDDKKSESSNINEDEGAHSPLTSNSKIIESRRESAIRALQKFQSLNSGHTTFREMFIQEKLGEVQSNDVSSSEKGVEIPAPSQDNLDQEDSDSKQFSLQKQKQISQRVIIPRMMAAKRISLQVPYKKSKWQLYSLEDNKAASLSPSEDRSEQDESDQQLLEEQLEPNTLHEEQEEKTVYEKNKQIFFNTFLNRKNNMEVINNFEIKIWEQLLNNTNIVKNEQGKYVVEINTYKGVIRETLLNTILHLGQEENVNFEIYVENFFKPTNDLFEPFYTLRLRDTALYSLYIRISFLERTRTHNDKIMLRQILFNYFNEESYNLQNRNMRHLSDVMLYEFNLADIRRLAVFVMNKIRMNYIKQSTSSSFTNQYTSVRTQFAEYSLKFNNVNEFYQDQKCPQVMKVNIDKSIESIMNDKLYQYVLLHRGLFSLRPQQMVAVFYRANKKRFYLYIWNTKNAKNKIQILSMQQVEIQIPHVQNMLELKLYLEIGKRILLSFKNNLMIQTFFILNELPQSTDTNEKFPFVNS